MKFFKFAFPVGIALALMLTGCSDLKTQFETFVQSSDDNSEVFESQPDPPAVTIASMNGQGSLFESILPIGKSKSWKQAKFKGLDSSRPFVACIWLNEQGTPKPVFYVPVKDYEAFLNSLAKKYPLHQAIASKFRVGRRQFVVMDSEGYAKIAPSLEAANSSEVSPGNPLAGLPPGHDFVFRWNPNSLDKKHAPKILKTVKQYLGDGFAPVLSLDSSLVFSMAEANDASNGITVQVENPPAVIAPIRSQVESAFAVEKWSTERSLTFSVNKSADDSESDIAENLQSASSNLFKAHMAGLAKRRSRGSSRQSFGLDRISNLIESNGGFVTSENLRGSGGGGSVEQQPSTSPAKSTKKRH